MPLFVMALLITIQAMLQICSIKNGYRGCLTLCYCCVQVHSQIAQWSQDLFQLKSIMETLEEEEELDAYEPMLTSGNQPDATARAEDQPGQGSLQSVTAELNQKTEAALAGSQGPKDGISLLEDIASLSKQMVGEAQEDVELFKRASSKTLD